MPLLVAIAILVAAYLAFRSKSGAAGGTSQPGAVAGPSGSAPSAQLPLLGGTQNALDNISQAIFQFEGGNAGNRNVVNNNPGNLTLPAANQVAPGLATGSSGGYAAFADQGDGWDALNNYLLSTAQSNPQWDFYDTFQHYLGQTQGGPAVTNQGNSNAYAEYVANYLGVPPTTPVSNVLWGG